MNRLLPHLRWALLGLVLCLCLPAQAEVIRSFDAHVRLLKNSTLEVTETIVYDFETAQRHGIYRTVPVVYDRYGGTYTILLKMDRVTDESGATLPYTTSRQGRDLNIKIGDPDRKITGVHTYKLGYRVLRSINYFNKAPEVYWNVTGNQWPVPMQAVRAHFYPPPGVDLGDIRTDCFVGPPGSTRRGGVERSDGSIMFDTPSLAAGEELTLLAGLPAGSVTPPSMLQTLAWLLEDWWPAVLLPLLALAFVLARWFQSGRDVDGGQAVAVEWNPPKNLTPAEVGTLVDEHCDMADIVSTLVDLAARGYLVIQETQATKSLFLSNKDYTFVKLPPPSNPQQAPLLPHEAEFLRGLFGAGDQVTLSSLKNHFYTHLPVIKAAIYQSLTDKRMFNGNPESVRSNYAGVGCVMLIVGVMAGFYFSSMGLVAYAVGLGGAGLVVWIAARAMPSKTATGSRALRECLGFQRFVQMAEKDRIAVLAKDDPTLFGRLLPYAMVLGVADQWADSFKDLLRQPPDWYVPCGYGPNYSFSPHVFVHDLGGGMNTMGSTFSSTPPSTAGSGGSGFSSGGGFSGGGFGGGGGGSW